MALPIKIPAVIDSVIDHLEDVRTLILLPQRRSPKFKPGQFLHLAIDPYDPSTHWPESRVFSICSPPENREKIRITFSRVGKFTGAMMNLRAGAEVWLKYPYGDFTIESKPGTENILIAGGTGITPFMSWIWSSESNDSNAHIMYGARSPKHLIFAQDLEDTLKQKQKVRWTPFIESGQYPRAIKARLNVEDIVRASNFRSSKDNYNFYISGPPQMINTLKEGLIEWGVKSKDIFIDAW